MTGWKIDTAHVVKLDCDNFQIWKLQITLVLKAAEVFDVVSGIKPKPPPEKVADLTAWQKEDTVAQAIIVPSLGINQINHVFTCTSSKEMFERLKDINSDSSTLNKQHVLTNFLSFKPLNNFTFQEKSNQIYLLWLILRLIV